MATVRAIEGLYPVVPTPLRGGVPDPLGCAATVEFLAPHVHGLTLLGSMGEGPNLSVAERRTACEAFVEACAGRLGIVLGIGAAALADVLELARQGEDAKVDALFLPAPGYYTATQAGLLDFFVTVAQATSIPIVLYDNPYVSRTRLSSAFMAELVERAPTFRYVKVTDRAPGKVEAVLAETSLVPLSGSDELMHTHVMAGARGVLTGVPCAVPAASRRWWDACEGGDSVEATRLFASELSLMAIEMIGEGDEYPAFTKACLFELGIIGSAEVRLPLRPIPNARVEVLRRALSQAGQTRADGAPVLRAHPYSEMVASS